MVPVLVYAMTAPVRPRQEEEKQNSQAKQLTKVRNQNSDAEFCSIRKT